MARSPRGHSSIKEWIIASGMLVVWLVVAGALGWMTGKLAVTFAVALAVELAASVVYVRRLWSERSLDRLSGLGVLIVLATLTVGLIEFPCFRVYLYHDWCEQHFLRELSGRADLPGNRESASIHTAMKREALEKMSHPWDLPIREAFGSK